MMLARAINFLRRMRDRQMVRPWALAGPIIVLMICLPMLRPLRQPSEMAEHELLYYATTRALVEHRTQALAPDDVVRSAPLIEVDGSLYSAQPPVMAMLLAGPYWVMHRWGVTFEHPVVVPYVLTLLATTFPVALAAGLIYRMGRMFELRRPWRTGLGLACVLGSGLISYAVVLNPHAPAAVLILGSAGCLIHVAFAKRLRRTGGWLALSGLCAALAAALDPAAAVLAVLFIPVVIAIPFTISLRIAGVLLFLVGMVPPIVLHCVMTVPITGDILPGSFHPELAAVNRIDQPIAWEVPLVFDDEEPLSRSMWLVLGRYINRLLIGTIGDHGIFSHFPVLILGVIGVAAVMHRHWPGVAKVLAAATIVGSCTIVLIYSFSHLPWREAMFASRWFVVFLPLLFFWAGAWLRRTHSTASWSVAGLLLLFSTVVSLIGATNPYPRGGFNHYTAIGALRNLVHTPPDTARLRFATR
jgi:hypothetical protein